MKNYLVFLIIIGWIGCKQGNNETTTINEPAPHSYIQPNTAEEAITIYDFDGEKWAYVEVGVPIQEDRVAMAMQGLLTQSKYQSIFSEMSLKEITYIGESAQVYFNGEPALSDNQDAQIFQRLLFKNLEYHTERFRVFINEMPLSEYMAQ